MKLTDQTAVIGKVLLSLCVATPAMAFWHAGGGSGGGWASRSGDSAAFGASDTHYGANGGSLTRTATGSATRYPNGTTSYSGSQRATYTSPDGQSYSGSRSTTGTAYGGYGAAHSTYTTSSGATAYHSTYYGTTAYAGYHPPTTVNYYGSGCYNCGGWSSAGAAAAGVAVGMVAGAAVASANANANSAAAYNAGVAAGASSTFAVGAIYGTLPAGSAQANVQGQTYYISGNTWFQPSYGANGVYYRVVPAP